MPLAPLYGTLGDIDGSINPSDHLRLVFQLNAPAIAEDGTVVNPAPAYVDTFTGASGAWEVFLRPTEGLAGNDGPVRYLVSIQRRVRGQDSFPTDLTRWRIRLPVGGGRIDDMVTILNGAGGIDWGVGPPPAGLRGVTYIDLADETDAGARIHRL